MELFAKKFHGHKFSFVTALPDAKIQSLSRPLMLNQRR